MKGYKKFLTVFCILLLLYVIAEMNRPKELDWTITLSLKDKNPYGGLVLYELLPSLFPEASVISTREPLYNTLEDRDSGRSAYLLIDPEIEISQEEQKAMMNYVAEGNYIFLTTLNASRILTDSLRFSLQQQMYSRDSSSLRLINPAFRPGNYFPTGPMTADTYFKKLDTARSTVLGENKDGRINYISMSVGSGKIFIHALPLCFSNAFLLKENNAEYVSNVLSYLPKDLETVYWDEYYKQGREGSTNPLRFILGNEWLKWFFRISLLAMLTLLLFESKRRQRIIPIVKPLRNATLDFVQTVGNVYYHHRNNKNLALKKISHFTEFVRTRFYLPANPMNEDFVTAFSAKSGIGEAEVNRLVELINYIQETYVVDDKTLLQLNREIDFYYDRFA